MLAIGKFAAIQASACQQAGQLRDADAEYLMGSDMVYTFLQIRNLVFQAYR